MGRETAFFWGERKALHYGSSWDCNNCAVCVCICVYSAWVCVCVCFLSELMFFVNVYKCVCAFVLSLHRGDAHLTKVSSV